MNATTELVRPCYSISIRERAAALYKISAELLLATLPDSHVDLVVTSPPYCMGKEYEKSTSATDFLENHRRIFPEVFRVLKPGGSLCWQVGHHVTNGVAVPLDALVYLAAMDFPGLILRNRIVWTFGHGTHSPRRFSGRHENLLWFTKGDKYTFDLDAVRVPQRYPGKRHYKGKDKGKLSGNPLGKNPGDVWDMPNVKARHIEKTAHPCQFPVALPRRLVRALTKPNDLVLDPYLGSGSSAVAALLEGRNFIGCDIKQSYLNIAKNRLKSLESGSLEVRTDEPPAEPNRSQSVAKLPSAWHSLRKKIHAPDV
ncbi:MAG: site-specific DNA-methyltransferase [Rhizomicrobium sp.]|jgi:adenine-specific DNA-methyltransferase